jgi:hypothetical protein
MKKPIVIFIAGALLILILVLIFLSKKDTAGPEEIRGVPGDPTDITMDFFSAWYGARNSSTSDPYTEGLATSTVLSLELSNRLLAAETDFKENGIDPVLCQSTIPGKLRSKSVFETEDKAQIMILPKDNQSTKFPVVTLLAKDGLWQITDILCSDGEQDPNQGEFSFDKEGQLLKDSLKPPLDNQYWHLVFEESGTFGYTAPLFLSENSVCKLSDGSEETCRGDMFSETQKVYVQGDMTEAGVDVKRIEIK